MPETPHIPDGVVPPESVTRVLDLFRRALERPAEEREAWVRRESREEAWIADRVCRLLEADRLPLDVLSATLGPASVEPLPLPARLQERYTVRDSLGGGGMGTVVLAHDELLGRDVAIKLLAGVPADRDTARRRLLSEARAASRIDHPNVCPVYDVGEDEAGGLYIVMAFCEGGTLEDRLRRDSLSVPEAIGVITDAARGLNAAHEQGIIHRDVKPSNIALTPTGAKVLDFGIAASGIPEGGDDQGGLVGTLPYMSPERLAGAHADERSDIWSLGVVLGELLTGRRGPPDAGAKENEVSLASVPKEVRALMERMVSEDPAARPASMLEVLRVLESAVAAPILAARGPGPPPDAAASRGGGPRRSGFAIVLAGVALAGAATAVALATWDPAPEAGERHEASALSASSVVVLPFENRTGIDSLDVIGEWVASWIVQGLMEAGVASVVPLDEVATAAADISAGPADKAYAGLAVGPGLGARVAARFGARTAVTGTVFRAGERLEFHATVTDAATGEPARAPAPVEATIAAPSAGFADLTRSVVSAVAVMTGSEFARFTGLQSQPPTYQAYREFARGSDLFGRSRFVEAIRFFERAATADSSYTLPVLYMAHAYANSGRVRLENGQLQPIDSLLQLVEARRDELPAYDLHFLDFSRAVLSAKPDWSGSLQAARRLHAIAPGARTSYDVGAILARTNRPREAIDHFLTMDPARGEQRHWMPYWKQLTAAYHVLGRHAEEQQAAERALALNPSSEYALALHLRALAGRGQARRVADTVDSLFARPPRQGATLSTGTVAEEALMELAAHGHVAEARRVRDAIAARYRDPAGANLADIRSEDMLLAHVVVEDWDSALQLLDNADATPRDAVRTGLEGIVFARMGRTEAATERMRALAADSAVVYDIGRRVTWARGDRSPPRWAAEIAAALGQGERAGRMLASALSEGLPYGTWLHAAPGLRYTPAEALLDAPPADAGDGPAPERASTTRP